MSPLTLGLDLGSSGLRLALVDGDGHLQEERQIPYPGDFNDPESWRTGVVALFKQLTAIRRRQVMSLAICGTSGTLLLCRRDGSLLSGLLSRALPYHQAMPAHAEGAATLSESSADESGGNPAAGASGSLARALALLEWATEREETDGLILRHQADWVMGWLLGDWRWGEEANNLRLGWEPDKKRWAGMIAAQSWSAALPQIASSGSLLGVVTAEVAELLGLPRSCHVVAGSTDANAAVLAAEPALGDGITVLGTTLVLKQFSQAPLDGPGISNHRVAGRWLVGGASNAGAGILRRFFTDAQITELSRQIDPGQETGLHLRPLCRPGERFPVDDPLLPPVLEPRPVSDALYLQALLEGLTAIEVAGWRQLQALGTPKLKRVITLGGGARNAQWRALRQRALGIPILNRPGLTAAMGMARLARRGWESDPQGPKMAVLDTTTPSWP